MKTLIGLVFLILVIGLIVGFILPAVFKIVVALLVIYGIYRLIKWYDKNRTDQNK